MTSAARSERTEGAPTRRGVLRGWAAVAGAPVAGLGLGLTPLPPGAAGELRSGAPPATIPFPSPSLRDLEADLGRHIAGQSGAVAAVAGAIRRALARPPDPTRPLASFLFLGPVGVGKTMLVRAMAECSAGSGDAVLSIDLDAGWPARTIADAVRRRPSPVLLFDEIDGAGAPARDGLARLLDGSGLTDGEGQAIDLSHTLLVLTRSSGAEPGTPALAPTPWSPGAVDEVIPFRHLDRGVLRGLLDSWLEGLRARLAPRLATLELSDAATDWLLDRGYSATHGARPLGGLLRREVEAPIVRRLPLPGLARSATARVDVAGQRRDGSDGGLVVSFAPGSGGAGSG